MNKKLSLIVLSTLFVSLSSVADSKPAETHTQFRGGPYDMTGYLNLMNTDKPAQTKQTSLKIKGGSFDMNGYLNAVTENRPSTAVRNKSVYTAKLNIHATPNLLFSSGS
ncbi:MAG: hypothetical protein ACRBB6_01660 [Neptuniibacter sp.]